MDGADSRSPFNSYLEQATDGGVHVASHSSQSSIRFPGTADHNGLHTIKMANNAKLSRSGCRVISKEGNEGVNTTKHQFQLFGKY